MDKPGYKHSSVSGGMEWGTFVLGGIGIAKGAYSLVQKGFSMKNGMITTQRIARPVITKNEQVLVNYFLTREKIKSFLSNAKMLNKEQIITDVESIGLKLKG